MRVNPSSSHYDSMKYPLRLTLYLAAQAATCATVMLVFALISTSGALANPSLFALHEKTMPPPFSAEYDIHMGNMTLGQLRIDLRKNNSHSWTYRARTQAKGLASLFVGGNEMTETSHLELIDDTIRPVLFERIQVTNSTNKSERAIFEWHNNSVKTSYKDRRLQHPLNKYSLDKFTLQLALMNNLASLPERSTVAVISKAKMKKYVIIRHGTETVDTAFGHRQAVVIERLRDDASYMIWADSRTHGIPLKIQHIKQGKMQYEVVLASSSLF